jgi:hypothetical protein
MIKSIKQYCKNPSKEALSELERMNSRYSKLRNYFFDTHGGTNGLPY